MTGATGAVGRHLVTELLALGQRVQAGVPDPAGADLPAGAVPVRLDFSDPATADPALAGVDRLYLLRPPSISDVRAALGPLIAAAARDGGLRQVAVLSVSGVNPLMPHWRMERRVRTGGLPFVVLRPSYFAQNLLTAFGEDISQRSELRLAAGAGRLSFVDARDVAAVAARALTDSRRLGRRGCRPQRLLQRRREVRARGLDPTYVRVQLLIDLTARLGLAGTVTDDVTTFSAARPSPWPTSRMTTAPAGSRPRASAASDGR